MYTHRVGSPGVPGKTEGHVHMGRVGAPGVPGKTEGHVHTHWYGDSTG